MGWKLTARGNYETAAYQLLDSEGPFELRDYPEIMLVTTDMATASNGNDGSFGRLFQYISGSNERGQKVKMTTPVFMESDPTEPTGTMGFVIPWNRAFQIQQVPAWRSRKELPADTLSCVSMAV